MNPLSEGLYTIVSQRIIDTAHGSCIRCKNNAAHLLAHERLSQTSSFNGSHGTHAAKLYMQCCKCIDYSILLVLCRCLKQRGKCRYLASYIALCVQQELKAEYSSVEVVEEFLTWRWMFYFSHWSTAHDPLNVLYGLTPTERMDYAFNKMVELHGQMSELEQSHLVVPRKLTVSELVALTIYHVQEFVTQLNYYDRKVLRALQHIEALCVAAPDDSPLKAYLPEIQRLIRGE